MRCERSQSAFRTSWSASDANIYSASDVKVWLENWATEQGIMPDKDLTITLFYKPVQTMTLSRVGDNNSSSLKIVLPDDFTGLPTYQYGDVNFVNGKAILTLTGSEDALVLKLPESPTVLHFTASGGSPLDPFAILDSDNTLIVYQSSSVDQYDMLMTDGYSFEFMGEAFPIACSHTPNIGDDGVQLSNYANNWKLADVVTIPGVTSLHLIITYGGESESYDWVCAWAGDHPDYDPYDYSSSLTGRLGGGNHTDPANTKEFDVSGDTVTFIYKSDGSSCGDGYGYYAIIQGVMSDP